MTQTAGPPLDDPLDVEIQRVRNAWVEKAGAARSARAAADKLTRDAELVATELRALERAAELRPHTPQYPLSGLTGLSGQSTSPRKGRQVGAISKNWRIVLLAMAVYYPTGATEHDIVKIVEDEKLDDLRNLRPRDATRQMKKYEETGYIEAVLGAVRSWRITEFAAQRFNIDAESTLTSESKTATDSQSVAVSEPSDAERASVEASTFREL